MEGKVLKQVYWEIKNFDYRENEEFKKNASFIAEAKVFFIIQMVFNIGVYS